MGWRAKALILRRELSFLRLSLTRLVAVSRLNCRGACGGMVGCEAAAESPAWLEDISLIGVLPDILWARNLSSLFH
jgi:hypothetical protein